MKVCAAGVCGCIMALLLKRTAPELSLALTTAASVMASLLAMRLFGELTQFVQMAQELTGLSAAVLGPVMKCLGIGVVTRLAADLCKDAGQSAVSSAVELCGAACGMLAALPLLRALLQMIGELL